MRRFFLFLPWLMLVGVSLAQAGAVTDSPKLKIIASHYPLAYFAERIGGNRVVVNQPSPPGEDPAFWKPNAKAVGDMQKADLILLNGADYEKWLPRVSLSKFKLADTSATFRNEFIRIENAVTHSHGPGGMHSHEGTAFTTWLDFGQAGKQADATAQAMIRKRPELKTLFLENLKTLQADLAGLDAELKAIAALKPGLALFASHPVYQYLARRYGLNLKSVHWEPNEMPGKEEWEELQKSLAAHPARWMIWEDRPDPEIADKLQSLGLKSLVFSPCANRPESGDFLEVMKENLENLRSAMH
ncbi:MAG: metal ABC transporter substrate-binding protein [Methylococcaceae bacterium]|nr:metal ABC transporter substrate-binding protein [Methylococcaceae bacterium]